MLVPNMRTQASSRGSRKARAIFWMKSACAPRYLRCGAFAIQERASHAPALQRRYGAGEQRDTFSAVSRKAAVVSESGRRHSCGVHTEHVAASQLQVRGDEIVCTQRARRIGGATVVFCSAQNVSFVCQLCGFRDKRRNARDDVR